RVCGAALRECLRSEAALRRRGRCGRDLHAQNARGRAGDDLRRWHQDARLRVRGGRRGGHRPRRDRTCGRHREPGMGTRGLGPGAVSRNRGCDRIHEGTDLRGGPAGRHRAHEPRRGGGAADLGLDANRGAARWCATGGRVERPTVLSDVVARFAIDAPVVAVEPFSGPAGHINASFVVTARGARDRPARFFLQRLNRHVFPDLDALMENVARVTRHVGGPLRLVPTREGLACARDDQGDVWRLYGFIERAVARAMASAADAERAAGAFGAFQRALADMPGLALFDFGDLVRSMATRAAEDERDTSRVRLEPELFESIARGYVAATRELLTPAERELLVPAAQVIVFEQAVRFLIDHLEGDRYYRIARPGHNLDRCRTQLALLDALLAGERALEQI